MSICFKSAIIYITTYVRYEYILEWERESEKERKRERERENGEGSGWRDGEKHRFPVETL